MNIPMTPVQLGAFGTALDTVDVQLERDGFSRRLIRELAGTLQDVVGIEEAAGYISVVGTAMGEQIDDTYRKALAVDRISRDQVRDVLVDLKRRDIRHSA